MGRRLSEDGSGGKSGIEGNDCDSVFFRLSDEFFAIKQKGSPGLDGDGGATGAPHRIERTKTHDGDIEAHIVVVFGDLDDHGAAARDTAPPQDGGVGSFKALDGKDDTVFYDNGLADIQIANGHGDAGAERKIGFLLGGKGLFREQSGHWNRTSEKQG